MPLSALTQNEILRLAVFLWHFNELDRTKNVCAPTKITIDLNQSNLSS
jgi:hypothetical protein